MRIRTLGVSDLRVSRIAYGCMGIGGSWDDKPLTADVQKAAMESLDTAVQCGINFFDHADIYRCGKGELAFGHWLRQRKGMREKILIQSKCGIRGGGKPQAWAPARFDFSYEHIMASAEGILKRLGVEYLDALLLHRPDALVEPEEVARAFDALLKAGKVRHFGVSNHNAAQIDLLRKAVRQPIVANQVEISLLHTRMLDAGIDWNIEGLARHTCVDGTLEYCRLHDITLQAWSPLAKGLLTGRDPRDTDGRLPRIREAAKVVAEMAEERNVEPEAMVVAWLLRHPAGIQPIIGTSAPERIKACCQADALDLSREEWYRLYVAGRGRGMP